MVIETYKLGVNSNRIMRSIHHQSKNEKRAGIGADLKKEISTWLNHTQFHGAQRLADRRDSWFCIPSMLGLLILAITVIYLTIHRFQMNATYITRQETVHEIQPFPSVIICPEVLFHDYKKTEFLSNLSYPEGLNRSYIWKVLPQLAAFYAADVLYKLSDVVKLEKFLEHNNIDVETAGRQLALSCEEALIRCRWKGELINCTELFRMELTGDGFCCVFNGRSLRREMKEIEKEKSEIESNVTNWTISETGYASGLMVAVNQSQKPDNIDLSYKWLGVQASQSFVDVTLNGTVLNPSYEQWLMYRSYSFHITDTAKDLRPSLRKCNLATEPLKYFPIYRRRYCVLECEIARTIKLCRCARAVHPKPRGTNYCNARRLRCAKQAMLSSTNGVGCHCPQTCDLDISSSTTASFLLDPTVKSIDSFYDGLDYDKLTIVRAFLTGRQKKSRERNSYYKYVDLFAQLGGMFNVVFGCSILTILGLQSLLIKIIVILLRYFITRILKVRRCAAFKIKLK